MNRYFNVHNLTQERLESYLHGWAILNFLLYGYRRNVGDPPNVNIGGPMSHPNWHPSDICNFWDDIGDDWFRMTALGVSQALFDSILGFRIPIISDILRGLFNLCGSWDITLEALARLPYSRLRNISPQLDWYKYLESPEMLQELWNVVPEDLKTPEAQREFNLAKRNLKVWADTAHVCKPNLRSSYADEVTFSIMLGDLYHRAMVGGSDSIGLEMNGISTLLLAKKAGLTGGMFDLPDSSYHRQPGVFYAGFEKDGHAVWDSIVLNKLGGRQPVVFKYDLIGLGSTRLSVKAKTATGVLTVASRIHRLQYTYEHWKDSLVMSGLELANADACTLWFEIETENGMHQFTTMLSSKYDSAYQAHSAISSNLLYQQLYNAGDPTRTTSQNPFEKPDSFWPYALRVTVIAKPGWWEMTKVPATPAGKAVKDGGWLSFDPGSNLIYGAKGNKSADFYRYHINGDSWHELTVIPLGTEAKLPKKGCVGAADGAGHVYMTKGNNTLGFWKYYADGDSWEQIADVPLGNSNKKVKGGTDMVYVVKNETNRA